MKFTRLKYSLHFFLFFICLSIISLAKGQSKDFPDAPNSIVSDFGGVLDQSQINALEQKLVDFDNESSIQIAVVIMNSTGDYDIADYGDRLAQKWGIGNKKYDNGVLLLVALADRAVTIRTGYGIEGSVPDVIAYRIIENEIKPAFRQENYYQGINSGVDALISYTKGEYKADRKPNNPNGGGVPVIFIIIVIIVLISLISKGGNKGGGKMINSRGASDIFWWTLLNQLGRESSGRSSGGGGFGGGFGGGGFGGGSGGGFGGFGGGGFGGGGASGRW